MNERFHVNDLALFKRPPIITEQLEPKFESPILKLSDEQVYIILPSRI